MRRIPLRSQVFDGPTTVVVEASFDAILDLDLDTFEGEQYDRIESVIAIDVDRESVTLETCRSLKAWRAGVPNAGRGTLTLPRHMVEGVFLPGTC
jgi:hypothetical protein